MVQVLALEKDARAANVFLQPRSLVDRAGPTDVVRQVLVERLDECRVHACRVVGRGQFFQRPDQGFGDEAPAVAAEVATGVGPGVVVDRAGVRRGGMVRIAHLSIPFENAAAAVPAPISSPSWESARRPCYTNFRHGTRS